MPQVSSSKLVLSRKAAKLAAVSEVGAGGFGFFVFGDETEGEGGHGGEWGFTKEKGSEWSVFFR